MLGAVEGAGGVSPALVLDVVQRLGECFLDRRIVVRVGSVGEFSATIFI